MLLAITPVARAVLTSLLPQFAAHYGVPVEMLEQVGDDRAIATFTPVRVVVNG